MQANNYEFFLRREGVGAGGHGSSELLEGMKQLLALRRYETILIRVQTLMNYQYIRPDKNIHQQPTTDTLQIAYHCKYDVLHSVWI